MGAARMKGGSFAVLQLLLLGGCAYPALSRNVQCEIDTGTNTQVTHTPGDAFMFEPVIAVNPRDPKQLAVGASIYRTEMDDVRPYLSLNGGVSWSEGKLIHTHKEPNHDTGMIYDRRGRPVLYANYGNKNMISTPRGAGNVWYDWRVPLANLDKPTLAQDQTSGKYSGQFYFFGMSIDEGDGSAGAVSHYRIRLARTMDLQYWAEETVTTSSVTDKMSPLTPPRYMNTGNDLLIARDGSLFLTFVSGSVDGSGQANFFVRSSDGGRTFSQPMMFARSDGTRLISQHANAWPAFAIDASRGKFSDRLYGLWFEVKGGNGDTDLLFSRSADNGRTWEQPRVIDTLNNPAGKYSPALTPGSIFWIVPAMQVNSAGVLLLTWYRIAPAGEPVDGDVPISYQRFVTASIDGGGSFFTPVPLASQAAVAVNTPGHYLKVVADRNGTFHEAWMDDRTGKKEIWYAPIRVLCDGKAAKARATAR